MVEIPDAEIKGASIDSAVEEIPVAEEAQLGEDEVVLEMPGQSGGSPGEATRESEEKISVDFPDEDVRTILRNVADLFELNLVIPDTLQGRTSLKLKNITWPQVFEVVLEPLGFTFIEDRNIVRIKSLADITTEPVETRVFVVNYAQANEIRGSVQNLVDAEAGGEIQVDTRSNALVITERPSRMGKIQEIIELLDKPNHQVMIESRFVDVDQRNNVDIGVDWSYSAEWFSDDSSGSVSTPYGAASSGLLAVFSEPEFNMTLEALEQRGGSSLISNPTVVVMNNTKAKIEVGSDFPIREFTFNPETGTLEAGELDYRFFGIKLEVTPSVNNQGMITLDVRPELSSDGGLAPATGPNNLQDQIFDTSNVEAQVTIKDGYTIAIGGLTRETSEVTTDQIPVLGDIPVLGKLFQRNSDNVAKRNLIVFLTAKTLNPDGTTYREIIDPRTLDEIDFTPSQAPGYQIPEDQMEQLKRAEESRKQLEQSQFKESIEGRIQENEAARGSWVEQLKLK